MEISLNVKNPKSISGRILTPLPKLDYSSGRKSINSDKRLMEWLYSNAKKEVEGNSYQECLLKAVDLNNLSPSDIDTLNLFLFGTTHAKIVYD